MALNKLTVNEIVGRTLREFHSGQTIVLGTGIPEQLAVLSDPAAGFQFISENGVNGYISGSDGTDDFGLLNSTNGTVLGCPGSSVVSTEELAAMLRGGHVDFAVVEASQIDINGSFTHWTTDKSNGIFAPGSALDLTHGCKRTIAIMPHQNSQGDSNIVQKCDGMVDGVSSVSMIVTDIAVLTVSDDGLKLDEVAPGWSVEDVRAMTGAPLMINENVKEIEFSQLAEPIKSKVSESGLDAVRDIVDGSAVMIDGFAGPGGMAHYLLVALRDHGAKELTIISNTAGIARVVNFGTPPGRLAIDHSILIENNQVRKAIASYPVSPSASRPSAFEIAYKQGDVELELVPQGTLAERLRAGGAGIGAFYTPTGAGTRIGEGKDSKIIDGKEFLLETGIRADYALIRGYKADTLGNVIYKGTSRNFNSVMAPAANITIVEVDEIVEPGELDPESIVTPGIYVNRVVKRPEDFSGYE